MGDVESRAREDRDRSALAAIVGNIPSLARALGMTERQVRDVVRDFLTTRKDVQE